MEKKNIYILILILLISLYICRDIAYEFGESVGQALMFKLFK